MSPHAQTILSEPEDANVPNPLPSPPREVSLAAHLADDPAGGIETVAIELNFNAFADHVPPTQHATRVARQSDPSIQDFADQALELAALRAELKRLTRDYESLQNALRVRDARLEMLQEQLASARIGLRDATKQLAAAQSRVGLKDEIVAPVDSTPATEAPAAGTGPQAHELTSTLELAQLSPEAAVDTPQPARPAQHMLRRQLIPVDHEGNCVELSRDIITVGRTRENDICIPSGAVSRDHARLLVSPRSVTVVDMNSGNGCFVNDEPVKKHKLRDGDVLRIGDRSYRFVSESSTAQ